MRDGAVFRVGGVMPSIGDGASTDTPWPHHAYGQCWTPTTAIALWWASRTLPDTIRL